MKKSPLVAFFLGVVAVTSFAQDSADSVGARRVAERDAAYAKQYPAVTPQSMPTMKHVHKHRTHRKVMQKSVK